MNLSGLHLAFVVFVPRVKRGVGRFTMVTFCPSIDCIMEIVYFTAAGIFLYFSSDWLLNWIETLAGRRFEYRSLIFFVIILILSLALFNAVQYSMTGTASDHPGKEMETSGPKGG